MMLYAKVVTIRDAQLNEKKVIEKEKQEEERRMDTVMEIERLKALKMYEEREAKAKLDRKLGASVIIDQMQEREKERVRQLETMKADEIKQQAIKKEMGKKLLAEVAMSNQ